MKAKKILGWIIVIAVILGLVFTQAYIFMVGEKIGLLFALGLSIVIFLVEVAISILIAFAIKWIID